MAQKPAHPMGHSTVLLRCSSFPLLSPPSACLLVFDHRLSPQTHMPLRANRFLWCFLGNSISPSFESSVAAWFGGFYALSTHLLFTTATPPPPPPFQIDQCLTLRNSATLQWKCINNWTLSKLSDGLVSFSEVKSSEPCTLQYLLYCVKIMLIRVCTLAITLFVFGCWNWRGKFVPLFSQIRMQIIEIAKSKWVQIDMNFVP